jgi:NADH dehydrogenase (ubiquinone) 1 beta subcomplex subunit 10
MEARLVRGELQKCYRGEGVNQLQNCKELAERYAGMIRENKVSLVICGWVMKLELG